jgi:hypothetical protein
MVGMPVLVILWGVLLALSASWLAKQQAGYLKQTFSHDVFFPRLWPHFFRMLGLLFVAWGVVMLLRGCTNG